MNRNPRMERNRRRKLRRKRIIINRIILLLIIISLAFILVKGKGKIQNLTYNIKNIYNAWIRPESDLTDPDNELDKDLVEKDNISQVDLLAVGDIMFHMPQIQAADLGAGNYDFLPPFKYVTDYISQADLAIGNFETVTLESGVPYSGFPRFNSPKESILALKEAGFDILTTANNHSLDQGREGILDTLKYIEEYGLASTGTFKEPGQRYLIEERNNIKFGILAYTYGLNGLDSLLTQEELSYMINLIDEEKIKEDIYQLKEEVDLIIVAIHWGNEYEREPNSSQIELGKKMVEWGANIILGSHPHVIQRSEMIEHNGRENFIIYSMGNFLSNQRMETMGNSYAEDGVMVRFSIEKDLNTEETMIRKVEFIPTWVHKYIEKNKTHYKILPVEEVIEEKLDIKLSPSVEERIEKSLIDTFNTLDPK